MLTEPAVSIPLTKSDLENQLKSFAKGELAASMKILHNQIKKDVHSEIVKLLGGEGELMKTLTSTLETVMNQVVEKNQHAFLAAGADGSQTPTVARLRRDPKKLPTEKDPIGKKHAAAIQRKTIVYRKESGHELMKAELIAQESEPKQRELELIPIEPGLPPTEHTADPLIPQDEVDIRKLNSIEQVVLSPWFEYGVAVMVILNVILIGAETELLSSSNSTHSLFKVLDAIFCCIFTIELIVRIYVYREQICLNDFLFQSTSFDALLVIIQIMDQVVVAWNVNIHVVTVLRIVRIVRIIRLVHLFDELSVLISGMTSGVSAMLWTVFLQALLMYMFSIFTVQVLITSGDLNKHDEIDNWFGSVDRAICTMFEVILGGVEWGDVLKALMYDVSPFMGLVMGCYIIVSLFFLMNLVCGVMVERVTSTVREDKDEFLAKRLSQAFTDTDEDGAETEVTWEEFASKLNASDDIQSFFSSIDVCPDETNARGLFELIDVDGSGTISGSKIVAGCLRLRGPAKAFELALMSKEISSLSLQAAAGLAASKNLSNQLKRLSTSVKRIAVSVLGDEYQDDDVNSEAFSIQQSPFGD